MSASVLDGGAWDEDADLLVFGSGAGGLGASLVGAIEGLQVKLFEKTAKFGGTTATSGGAVWVVAPTLGQQAGYIDSVSAGRQYLRHELGCYYRSDLAEAFLEHGAGAIDYLGQNSEVSFGLFPIPDYHADSPGGVVIGRTLYTKEFDGRRLGTDFERVRSPMRHLMVLGGLMIAREEMQFLDRPFASRKGLTLATRRLTRYARDRLSYSRGTRLLAGNALVARFIYSLRQRKVDLQENCGLVRLLCDDTGVIGAVVRTAGGDRRIRASRGVVLATGGPAHDLAARGEFMNRYPHQHSLAFEGNQGDGFRAGIAVGAAVDQDLASPALWTPASMLYESDGKVYLSPYGYLDRGKPGAIAIDLHGHRFCNEANSYHDVVQAMYKHYRGVTPIEGYLVCDSAFLWKYGMGLVPPRCKPVDRWVDRGYLNTSSTIEGLAAMLRVDGTVLRSTVERHNQFAVVGIDSDFGKGASTFNRYNGDQSVQPNPCLAPIAIAPFYALKIRPASLGTCLGLKTNEHSQVLDQQGKVIEGLYACGGDMGSVMRGQCPAGGVWLGQAIVFGYIAARHASHRNQVRAAAVRG